jgi:hypothetical protein
MIAAAPKRPDWEALADKLEAIADEMMAAAAAAPDEIEVQLMELHAVSIRHVARRMRLFPEEPKPSQAP